METVLEIEKLMNFIQLILILSHFYQNATKSNHANHGYVMDSARKAEVGYIRVLHGCRSYVLILCLVLVMVCQSCSGKHYHLKNQQVST